MKKLFAFCILFSAAVMGSALAATSRPSVIATASARMPTMAAMLGAIATTTTTATTITDRECIDAYTDCLKGGEVCGTNFEECTNKTLFYGKRPQCASSLMQCSAAAVNNLFGTSTQTAFASKNTSGEYLYPTNGSILGQLIEAAHINNRYTTSQCVSRYTSCLKKDDVCGADFELCTSNTEFKKQKLFCESTLARCQDDGLKELFGTTSPSANPTSDSRVGIMISEGAALAAVNSVATCYKVIDQCILNTCATNPYKCKEGASHYLVDAAGNTFVDDPSTTSSTYVSDIGAINRNDIGGFVKKSCLDTIGGNMYCYATFISNGVLPTNSQIRDEDNKSQIFAEAYSSRMNDSMKSKIDDLIERFDKKTKQRCQDSITSCAMRTCGDGIGSACYASAFDTANSVKGVTNPSTLADIKSGCEAAVNNDTSCKYAAATFQTTTGVLDFLDTSLFDKLFTAPDAPDTTNPDPVGAVGVLNAKLSTSYNQAALDQMKRQCTTVATGCVRSMCGADFVNCYRNRTDVYSSLTNTSTESFDKSMNKVGGVLDYTIILGLCLNTVKTNPVCEEHIRAEAVRIPMGKSTSSWGAETTVRDGWLGAGVYSATSSDVQASDENGNLMCQTLAEGGDIGRCDDPSGLFIHPKMESASSYNITQAERTVFRDLVYDLEKEAQAQYNAKLTKQQNSCVSSNNGGIIGTKDVSGTYQWAKLRSTKVPKEYSTAGLKENQFVASNDLYGSFCRIRVQLQSDDKRVQDAIAGGKDWSVAYFAAGDAFTCGSWIPQTELDSISDTIRNRSRTASENTAAWLGALGGGAAGTVAMDLLQSKTGLGGLLGTNKVKNSNKDVEACKKEFENSIVSIENVINNETYTVQRSENYRGPSGRGWTYKVVLCPVDTPAGPNVAATYVKCDAGNSAKQKAINEMMGTSEMPGSMNDVCGETNGSSTSNFWNNGVGHAAMDVAGGTLLGIGTFQVIRATQRASADNDARKWLDEVGQHIRCFIGSDEVGTYGDIISTEIE